MTVAVAHQAESSTRTLALQEAAREARLRGSTLAVLHVVESLDLDLEEAYRAGLTDEIEAALAEVGAAGLHWDLYLDTAAEDVAETILGLGAKAGARLLIIGARRRTPIGKFLLGSVTQSLILHAEMPVLVVKAPAATPTMS